MHNFIYILSQIIYIWDLRNWIEVCEAWQNQSTFDDLNKTKLVGEKQIKTVQIVQKNEIKLFII